MINLMRIMALAWMFVAVACSSAGNSDDDDEGVGDDGGGGVVTPEVTEVSGRFFLGDLDTPAVGHEVWILDHDDGTYMRMDLDPTGRFSVPIESFTEDHVYSLEMVRDYQTLGPIDLSEPNAGVQSGFLYRGGYGFDLGDVVLALDQYGRYDPDAGSLQARVGGGFSLSNQEGQSLASLALPEDVTSATMAAVLSVMDPQTALGAFYLRDDAPELYHRALAEAARVDLKVTTERNDMYEKIVVLQAGTWLSGARVAGSTSAAWDTAARWSDTKYDVKQLSSKVYSAGAFTGRAMTVGSVAVMQLHPKEDASRLVPVVLQNAFTMPPQVKAIGLAGGGATTIDYTSEVDENGLTRPFCRTADVDVSATRPLDDAGNPVDAADVASVVLDFDYYGQADGRSVAVSAKATDFPDGFDVEFEDAPNADLERAWDPDNRSMTLTYTEAAMDATEQAFVVPAELFLSEAGDAGVFSVRMRLTYVLTDGSRATIMVWFNEDC